MRTVTYDTMTKTTINKADSFQCRINQTDHKYFSCFILLKFAKTAKRSGDDIEKCKGIQNNLKVTATLCKQ